MSTSPNAGPSGAPDSAVRLLPPRPSLEYERKEAKTLLREIRRGDPEALRRVRAQWHGDDSRDPTTLRLADAQLTIAREYGFASWPRLVSYFETLERHERSPRSVDTPRLYEGQVRSLLAEHGGRQPSAAAWLVTFVPRFYGRSVADVLASPVTMDDARLTVARQAMCPSWEVLMERANDHATGTLEGHGQRGPYRAVLRAIKASDLGALSAAVNEQPGLLDSGTPDTSAQSLVHSALIAEMRAGSAKAREVTDWLASRGENLHAALGHMLCGHFHMATRDVEFLLDRGADPNWVAPNGISALEHALVRYWNPEAVDLVARRARPRKAFWTAAALGDVDAVARYVNRDGTLASVARRDRPDFTAMSPAALPSVPDAPDVDIICEAFFVAVINQRAGVVDLLLERGFPIDYSAWGNTMLSFAVGNRLAGAVEMLVRRGASRDIHSRNPSQTPRELARWRYRTDPTNADGRRILELCDGGDPDDLLRAYEAELAATRPSPSISVTNQLEVATKEALLLGQREVEPDNLFVAMFKDPRSMVFQVLDRAGANIDRMWAALGDRLIASDAADDSPVALPPLSAAARDVMDRAAAEASSRRTTTISPHHVLVVLVELDSPLITASLAVGGTTPARVREAVAELYFDSKRA